MPQNETIQGLDLDEYKYDFVTEAEPVYRAQRGLSEEVVREISQHKEEPDWMLDFRLKALEVYESKPMPKSSMCTHTPTVGIMPSVNWRRMLRSSSSESSLAMRMKEEAACSAALTQRIIVIGAGGQA